MSEANCVYRLVRLRNQLSNKSMENEYIKLIAELDRTLSALRDFWMNAKTPEESAKWRTRINGSLDERLRLMKARDAAKLVAA